MAYDQDVRVFGDVSIVKRAAQDFLAPVMPAANRDAELMKQVQKAISDIGIMAGMQVRNDVLVAKCLNILQETGVSKAASLSPNRLAEEISAPVSGW